MNDIRNTLNKRQTTYGSYRERAEVCQSLKMSMSLSKGWDNLSDVQVQSLEMIADKLSRVLNGDPSYKDNWVDIIGYAQLVLDDITELDNGQTVMEFDEETQLEIDEGRLAPQHPTRGQVSVDGVMVYNGKTWVGVNTLEGKKILMPPQPKEGQKSLDGDYEYRNGRWRKL